MTECSQRTYTQLERWFVKLSSQMFLNIYMRRWRLKTWPEMVDRALYDLHKIHAGKTVFKKLSNSLHRCQYKIRGVVVGTASASNEKTAKENAKEDAYQRLLKPYCRILDTKEKIPQLETSVTPFPEILDSINAMEEFDDKSYEDNADILGNRRGKKRDRNYTNFIIVKYRNSKLGEAMPQSIFHNSAALSGLLYEIHYSFDLETCLFTCKVKVEGHQTAVVSSDQKKKAKTLACEKSLEYLSQFCWTLFINGKVKSESKSKDWNEAKILIEKLSKKQVRVKKPVAAEDSNMRLLYRKDLDVKPPKFNTQFEEAVQKVLNDVEDNHENITLLEFPRFETKKVRKILRVYENLFVDEKHAESITFPRMIIRYIGDETDDLISVGSTGRYLLERPRGEDPTKLTIETVLATLGINKPAGTSNVQTGDSGKRQAKGTCAPIIKTSDESTYSQSHEEGEVLSPRTCKSELKTEGINESVVVLSSQIDDITTRSQSPESVKYAQVPVGGKVITQLPSCSRVNIPSMELVRHDTE